MAATIAGWITYAAARGDTVSDDAASAAALVRGQDHIQFHYANRFMASYDMDSPNVDAAVYEAAKLELASPGFFSRTFTAGEAKVLTEVKGIKWTVVGGETKADSTSMTPTSTKIEAMLRPYINRAAAVMTV